MAQFVLIDHSLSGPGSHHYEYATHILQAADQLGFEPVLASNRDFARSMGLPPSFRLFPLFRYSTYGGNTLAKPNDHRRRPNDSFSLKATWQDCSNWLRQWRRARRQRQRMESFRDACSELLPKIKLRDGDHVFLPTMSECDFLALSSLLQTELGTRRVRWHLQFHFDFLEGRPYDYLRQQDRIAQMRERFESALQGISPDCLRFYSTTREMADQYNRLGVARFDWLPYPVNPAFRPTSEIRRTGRPIRAVCAGRVRDEKGSRHLAQLVADLSPDLLSAGKLQLLVQGRRTHLERLLNHPVTACSLEALSHSNLPSAPIVQIPFPLPRDAYAHLIRQADLGLFLYDSYRYYARCSGVLVEMLCCGTPVIVPAGCWLAEEISEPNQAYLEWLRAELPVLEEFRLPMQKIPAISKLLVPTTPLPTDARMISIAPGLAVHAGYLKWEVTQLDSKGETVDRRHHIQPANNVGPPRCLAIPTHPYAAQTAVSVTNAYDDRSIELSEVCIAFHQGRRNISEPRGAVGLTSDDPARIGTLVRELFNQFYHYRATARAFSNSYRAIHQARTAVEQLVSDPAAGRGSLVA